MQTGGGRRLGWLRRRSQKEGLGQSPGVIGQEEARALGASCRHSRVRANRASLTGVLVDGGHRRDLVDHHVDDAITIQVDKICRPGHNNNHRTNVKSELCVSRRLYSRGITGRTSVVSQLSVSQAIILGGMCRRKVPFRPDRQGWRQGAGSFC